MPHVYTYPDQTRFDLHLDLLLHILEKWISIRTISGQPHYLEECRRGAKYIKNVMQQLGATSQLVTHSSCLA